MSLVLNIEPSSTVCESAKFTLLQPPSIITAVEHSDDSDDQTKGTMHLTIGQGNVFHPHSCFQIIPPPDMNHKHVIFVKIGSNNLFEEKSLVILDLSHISVDESCAVSDNIDSLSFSGIGSYNHFAPASRVEYQRIGNANIFGPKSNVVVKSIENGNLFQAGSFVRDEDGTTTTNYARYQDKVFYVLTGERHGLRRNACRKHADGVRKNMLEVSSLIRASKKVLRGNHRIMAATDIDLQ